LNDVIKLKNKGISSNSFAAHFIRHIKYLDEIKIKNVCKLIKVEIIIECNPISISKRFGTPEY